MTKNNGEYQFLVGGIIPSTQQAFKGGSFSSAIRGFEKSSIGVFKKLIKTHLEENNPNPSFPTKGQVYIAIIQFFTSNKKDYKKRDVDNMAKTVLDVLKDSNYFFDDDAQVRILLMQKI